MQSPGKHHAERRRIKTAVRLHGCFYLSHGRLRRKKYILNGMETKKVNRSAAGCVIRIPSNSKNSGSMKIRGTKNIPCLSDARTVAPLTNPRH